MESGIGLSVDQAGLSVVIAPCQVPDKVFIRSIDLRASELATGLGEDCPYTTAHIPKMKIDTATRRTLIFTPSKLPFAPGRTIGLQEHSLYGVIVNHIT